MQDNHCKLVNEKFYGLVSWYVATTVNGRDGFVFCLWILAY